MYCRSEGKIDDIDFFLQFYYDTLDILKVYAEAEKNSYVLEKLRIMPDLDHNEIDNYINRQNNY